jgi:hypothetical protein
MSGAELVSRSNSALIYARGGAPAAASENPIISLKFSILRHSSDVAPNLLIK